MPLTDEELIYASPGWSAFPGLPRANSLLAPSHVGDLGELRVVLLRAHYWQYLVRYALVVEVRGERLLAPVAESSTGPREHLGLVVLEPSTRRRINLTDLVLPLLRRPGPIAVETIAMLDLFARFAQGTPREGLAQVSLEAPPEVVWPGGLTSPDVECVASTTGRWGLHGTSGGWYSERCAVRIRSNPRTFTFERVPYERDGEDGIELS